MFKTLPHLFITFLCIVFFTCSEPAFGANWGSIDRRAINTPVSFETNIKKLVAYLTNGIFDEDKKARAIAVWIAYRIEYDDYKNRKITERVERGNGIIPSSGDAFVTRKGVCSDFAILFYKMAKEAGLEAAIVTGYAKSTGEKGDKNSVKHMWNAVKLNGYWYLLDVTWSAKNLQDKRMTDHQYARDMERRKQGNKTYYQQIRKQASSKTFSDRWFLTPPKEMIQTHYPDDPKWQLLNPTVPQRSWFGR